VIPNNATNLPILEAYGADRTLANAITLTSGFIVDSPNVALPNTSIGYDASGVHNLTLSGIISGTVATNGLTVQNGGNVTLTNTNTYAGPTLVTNTGSNSGGTLRVNGSNTGAGAVTVNGTGTGASAVGTGGTLGGTGSIAGTVTIGSNTAGSQGGIVSPGPGNAPGTLAVAAMSLQPFGRYVFAYNAADNTTGGGVNDLINGTSTLDLSNLGAVGGSTSTTPFDLNVQTLTGTPTGSNTYTVATFANGILGNVGGTPQTAIANNTDVTNLFTVSGSFQSGPPVDVMVVAGAGGGSSQSLQLSFTPAAVPEPASIGLLGLVAMAALNRRRRS
jgi:fibronectin-binding autotransporter adhesin